MTPRSFLLSQELTDYVRASSDPVDDVVADLVAETAAMAERGEAPDTLQIAPEQAVFMQVLARALGVRSAVEIGTFTGLSALAVARALPADGTLVCLDSSEPWTAVARRFWQRAGVGDRIDLRIGDAHELLRQVPAEPGFDFAFLDADKTGYADYVEQLYSRLRENGVVLIDNTLRGGRVLQPQSEDDRAVVALNAELAADPRWETVLLPLADGVTMLRKR